MTANRKQAAAEQAVGKALLRLIGAADCGYYVTSTTAGHILLYGTSTFYRADKPLEFARIIAYNLNAEAERLEDRKSLRNELNAALS